MRSWRWCACAARRGSAQPHLRAPPRPVGDGENVSEEADPGGPGVGRRRERAEALDRLPEPQRSSSAAYFEGMTCSEMAAIARSRRHGEIAPLRRAREAAPSRWAGGSMSGRDRRRTCSACSRRDGQARSRAPRCARNARLGRAGHEARGLHRAPRAVRSRGRARRADPRDRRPRGGPWRAFPVAGVRLFHRGRRARGGGPTAGSCAWAGRPLPSHRHARRRVVADPRGRGRGRRDGRALAAGRPAAPRGRERARLPRGGAAPLVFAVVLHGGIQLEGD